MSYGRNRSGNPWDSQIPEEQDSSELEQTVRRGLKGARKWGSLIGLGVAAALLFGMSYRPVASQNTGVVTRLGQYNRTLESGPHFIMPFFETMKQIDTTTNQSVEIGFRTVKEAKNGSGAEYRDASSGDLEMIAEAQMLTADENIAWVSMVLQYKVDPARVADYLFNVKDQEETILQVGEAALRQVVGNYGVDEVLTSGRSEIMDQVKQEAQRLFDIYGIGIDVQGIYLQNTTAPDTHGTDQTMSVVEAFRNVETARQAKDTKINEAEAYQNKVTAEAEGIASKTIALAQGQKATRIGEAERYVAEFNQLYLQYLLDPQGVRQRLYLETMENIYPNIDKSIVDSLLADGGLLPLLNLDGGN